MRGSGIPAPPARARRHVRRRRMALRRHRRPLRADEHAGLYPYGLHRHQRPAVAADRQGVPVRPACPRASRGRGPAARLPRPPDAVKLHQAAGRDDQVDELADCPADPLARRRDARPLRSLPGRAAPAHGRRRDRDRDPGGVRRPRGRRRHHRAGQLRRAAVRRPLPRRVHPLERPVVLAGRRHAGTRGEQDARREPGNPPAAAGSGALHDQHHCPAPGDAPAASAAATAGGRPVRGGGPGSRPD